MFKVLMYDIRLLKGSKLFSSKQRSKPFD